MQCSLVPVFSLRANLTIVHHDADLDSRPFYQFGAAKERRRAPQDGEKPRLAFGSALISRRDRLPQVISRVPGTYYCADVRPDYQRPPQADRGADERPQAATGVPTSERAPTAVPTTELKPTAVPTTECKPTGVPTVEAKKPTAVPTQEL